MISKGLFYHSLLVQAHKLRGGLEKKTSLSAENLHNGKMWTLLLLSAHGRVSAHSLFHSVDILKLTLMFRTRVRLQFCGNNLKKLLPSFITTGFLSSL